MEARTEMVEHPGEVALHVTAPDLGGVLVEAARALATLQLRGRPSEPSGAWRTFALSAGDPVGLLVEWLNELIYLAEAEDWVATEFAVERAGPRELRIRARGVRAGEPAGPVKAATYYGAELRPADGGFRASVVLDV